jgi:hypothetical protein
VLVKISDGVGRRVLLDEEAFLHFKRQLECIRQSLKTDTLRKFELNERICVVVKSASVHFRRGDETLISLSAETIDNVALELWRIEEAVKKVQTLLPDSRLYKGSKNISKRR